MQVPFVNETETVPSIVRYSLFGEVPLCPCCCGLLLSLDPQERLQLVLRMHHRPCCWVQS